MFQNVEDNRRSMLPCGNDFGIYYHFLFFFLFVQRWLHGGLAENPLLQEMVANIKNGVLFEKFDLPMNIGHETPICVNCRFLFDFSLALVDIGLFEPRSEIEFRRTENVVLTLIFSSLVGL